MSSRKIKDVKINTTLLSPNQRKILDSNKKPPGWLYGLVRRKKEELNRWRQPDTPFFRGQKEIYLPNFTITLLHTPGLPAKTAQFLVPLNLNKLDLRDYLWHAYHVRTFSVRSFIKLSPIQSVTPGSARDLPGKRRHWRPRATKKMIVTMDSPFVWPEAPAEEELQKGFDRERFVKMEADRQRQMKGEANEEKRNSERASISEQAQRLLSGKDRWRDVDVSATQGPPVGRFNLPLR